MRMFCVSRTLDALERMDRHVSYWLLSAGGHTSRRYGIDDPCGDVHVTSKPFLYFSVCIRVLLCHIGLT